MLKKLYSLSICLASISCGFAQISGLVFRDYNADGSKQGNEPTVEGISVKAFDSNDVLLSSKTSNSSGAYTFSALEVPTGSQARIEFVIPTGGSICGLGLSDYSAYSAATYGSAVQFIQSGAIGSSSINFAISSPDEYVSNTNPSVFMGVHYNGDPTGGGTAGTARWMTKFPFDNSSGTTNDLNGTVIGSTWGIAYSKRAKALFSAAFFRRQSGLGTNGSGAIYLIDENLTTATLFYDLDANGIATRASACNVGYGVGSSVTFSGWEPTYQGNMDPISGSPCGLGVLGTNTDRGLPLNGGASLDGPAFDQVGKVGLGGISLSADGKYLFVVNLYDRKVYRLELNSAAMPTSVVAVTAYTLPSISCNNGILRPFGVKVYKDSLYVGAVCTGENGGTNDTNQDGITDLVAYVFIKSLNSSTFDVVPALSIPLDFPKGSAWVHTDNIPRCTQWFPWKNDWDVPAAQRVGTNLCNSSPILSDIEFLGNKMILGFMDRGSYQNGWANFRPISSSFQFNYMNGGDLMAAFRNPSCNWQLESNGQLNGTTGSGSGNGEGRGGGEFFGSESYAPFHRETALGSIGVMPGVEEICAGVIDPTNLNEAGTARFSTLNGSPMLGSLQALATIYGKSGGLGDVEIMKEEAPIEIGNRIWADDGDGIQEAGEAALVGVSIELYSGDLNGDGDLNDVGENMLLGSTTSNSNGVWYFNQSNVVDGNPLVAGNQSGIIADIPYLVKVGSSNWNAGAGLGVLNGYNLTTSNASGNGQADLSDNDALLLAGIPTIAYTPNSGESNHNLDFGFTTVVFPIHLLDFSAKWQAEDVQLEWTVGEEINNAYFLVQRSLDNGLSFQTIASIEGAGNGGFHQYHYKDFNAHWLDTERLVYRLQQVDLDGSFSYSHSVELYIDNSDLVTIYPNPAKDYLYIQGRYEGRIQIFNILGQEVYSREIVSGSEISIPCLDWQAGLYTVKMGRKYYKVQIK